jgi:Class II Aldolase and Adducin N-terminal domain
MADPILSTRAYLESPRVNEACSLVAQLCRLFYPQGWVTGTGGSITVKVHDDTVPKSDQLIVMSPSGMIIFHSQPWEILFCIRVPILCSCGVVCYQGSRRRGWSLETCMCCQEMAISLSNHLQNHTHISPPSVLTVALFS